MSGYMPSDQMQEEDMEFDFPAVNNITIAGYMPHDTVPAAGKSYHFLTSHSLSSFV